MKRTIVNPHWINNAHTILTVEFHYDDGRILEASMSKSDTSNPDLAEILNKFSSEEILANTQVKARKLNKEILNKKEKTLALEERRRNEELFAIKLNLFEIEIIKNSTNRLLKSQIRKSKTQIEANAWAVGLMMNELNKQQTT